MIWRSHLKVGDWNCHGAALAQKNWSLGMQLHPFKKVRGTATKDQVSTVYCNTIQYCYLVWLVYSNGAIATLLYIYIYIIYTVILRYCHDYLLLLLLHYFQRSTTWKTGGLWRPWACSWSQNHGRMDENAKPKIRAAYLQHIYIHMYTIYNIQYTIYDIQYTIYMYHSIYIYT